MGVKINKKIKSKGDAHINPWVVSSVNRLQLFTFIFTELG